MLSDPHSRGQPALIEGQTRDARQDAEPRSGRPRGVRHSRPPAFGVKLGATMRNATERLSAAVARAFPVPGDAVRNSDGGGMAPSRARDGAVILFDGPEAIMSAQLPAGASGPTVRSRARLFSHEGLEVRVLEAFQRRNLSRRWDIARGSDHFIMVRSDEELVVVGRGCA